MGQTDKQFNGFLRVIIRDLKDSIEQSVHIKLPKFLLRKVLLLNAPLFFLPEKPFQALSNAFFLP